MNPCALGHDWRFDGFDNSTNRRFGYFQCVRCDLNRRDQLDAEGRLMNRYLDDSPFHKREVPDPPTPEEMARMRQELLDELALLTAP